MNIINYNDKFFWPYWVKLLDTCEYQYPLYSENGITYCKAYFKDSSFEDKSFIIIENDNPLVGVILTIEKNKSENILSGFGRGIFYVENENNKISLKAARKKFKILFNEIWSSFDLKSILYNDFYSISGTVSYLGQYLLDNGAIGNVSFPRIIDLNKSEEKIHSQLTKSCRNSVNWGLKNLDIDIINHQNLKEEYLDELRLLHRKEAGKETRSKSTWDIQYEMVKNNEAFIINGYLEDELVSSALFIHNFQCCLYGVSASRRDLFNKPISHAIVWKAILNAKKIGCRYFDFSVLAYGNNDIHTISDKEKNINVFKKSFGGNTKTQLSVVWKKSNDI